MILDADMRPHDATKRSFTSSHGWWKAGGILWLFGLVISVATALGAANTPSLDDVPPRPLREFRGAWIATVANLDWPSKPGLSTAEQQKELLAIMDQAVQLRLNVLILQVRPACDAFYKSSIEPWSEFLTGKMGRAPQPFYDPLAFAVEEAHRRGLELHAWFNPFRVRALNPKTGPAGNYMTRSKPSWVRTYGSQLWLDPGLQQVRDHAIRVILDVVKRYDIDGVHVDDYFYPYPEKNAKGQLLDFPDNPSWRAYVSSGGKLSRADWRRRNIDTFVQTLYQRVKAEKRWVKVGISPFGIWRPGSPPQVKKGLDAYDLIYTDSRRWLSNGWADYFAPQLYWSIQGDQSYPALLDWWGAQNVKGRILCPGNDATKVGSAWASLEILNQVRLTRDHPKANGNIFWNVTSVLRNSDKLTEHVKQQLYAQPALVPATPWLSSTVPGKPKIQLSPVEKSTNQWTVSWTVPKRKDTWLWLCQTRANGKWNSTVMPKDQTTLDLPARNSAAFPDLIAVTAIDRCGGTGPTALLDTRQSKRASVQ